MAPAFGDGREFGFFFNAPATHHFYSLLPYIRATSHRSVLAFGSTDEYAARLRAAFPDIEFRVPVDRSTDATVALLSEASVLVFANGYSWFVRDVQPRLPENIVFARVRHGTGHKLADDPTYYLQNVYAWDELLAAGRKDLDMFYDYLSVPPDRRNYGDVAIFPHQKRGQFQHIQAGNLRVRSYLADPPETASLFEIYPFLQRDRKTLLVMPTHASNAQRTINNYSGLSFCLDLLEESSDPARYNILFKLHPNLAREQALIERLRRVCAEKGISIDYDMFTVDYLPMMQIADLLVADRTSAVFDFLFFDKPIVFLDHLQACPETIPWEETGDTYWSFRNGPVVSPRNAGEFEAILERALHEDSYRDIRSRTRDYAFGDKAQSAENILRFLLAHPKRTGAPTVGPGA